MITPAQQAALDALEMHGSKKAAARALGIAPSSFRDRIKSAQKTQAERPAKLAEAYNLDRPERTPEDAWNGHADAFERAFADTARSRWQAITRPRGAFVIYHTTDEHLDDDRTPLRLIEADIRHSHAMSAIMCHGGDALNNWPMAGKLAAQWAQQQCTAPDALLRLKHYIKLLRPDAWTDGNHEEMNPYLDLLIREVLPESVIRDYWTVRFRVETPEGRPVRVVMSHKFQKGSSWFHKAHGHIREMLEGEECDLLMDGHLHSDGVLDHTLSERSHAALCVASAGYKVLDRYAARISRGGTIPKLRGRAHWIVADPFADFDANLLMAFKDPVQAEVYFNGLQNLRAV